MPWFGGRPNMAVNKIKSLARTGAVLFVNVFYNIITPL